MQQTNALSLRALIGKVAGAAGFKPATYGFGDRRHSLSPGTFYYLSICFSLTLRTLEYPLVGAHTQFFAQETHKNEDPTK